MNKGILIFISAFCAMQLQAQQVPLYNHVVINPFVYNPAMAGASGDVNAFLVRNQRYASFATASVNNYLTIDGAFAKQRAGFGVQVSNQTAGIQQQFAASLTYAYRLKINDDQDIRFGLNAGLLDNRLDVNAINVEQVDDPYLISMRPAVTSFDMNAGAAYRWKSLNLGLAVPQLIGNKVAFDKENSRGYYRLSRHIMFSASYDFPLTKSGTWSLKPVGFLRYVPGGAPIQYDVLVQVDHRKFGWFAAGYKSGYSVQFNIGFNFLKQFKVGYSYEYLVGSIKNYSSGAHHELMLGFRFGNRQETVPVPDNSIVTQERDTLKEQLIERNRELEELLMKTLAEKELIKEQQNELIRQNEELQREKEAMHNQPEKQPANPGDTNAVAPPKDPVTKPPLEKIPYAKGYRFIDLDLADSPDGFYVITGVFSSRKNADAALTKSLQDYANSYLVINKKNGFYYVVILYSLDQEEATKVFKKYKRTTKKDAWILNYHLES
ncbi:MAG TPA: PorP/SprF family type IX secretion system membrane protein [Fluviicola sp.]|nr:PorP/SprF family type IX secretion system membrane protein [Fluviicola sp.]